MDDPTDNIYYTQEWENVHSDMIQHVRARTCVILQKSK